MAELHGLLLPPVAGTARAGEGLTRRAAAVVEGLATVVADLGSADPTAGTTVDFLRRWAEEARRGDDHHTPEPRAPHPLDRLVDRFRLSRAEHDLVVLAGLPDEHEGLAGTLRALHPSGEPRPTVGLAGLLRPAGAGRGELRRLLGEGPAVRSGLLRVEGSGGWPERTLVLADRLWDVLHGVDTLPATLTAVAAGGPLPGLDAWLDEETTAYAARAVRDRAPVTVLLTGDEVVVTLARCAALLASVGATALSVAPPLDNGALDIDQVRLAAVHAVARDAVPVLVLGDVDAQLPGVDLAALTDVPGPVVVVAPAGRVRPRGLRPVLAVPTGPLPPESGRQAWRALLPAIDDVTAAAIAARTPADPAWIAGVARDVMAAGQPATPRAVAAAMRRRTGTTLPPGVALVSPAADWDQLVLPVDAAAQLREAVTRLEHQGLVLDDWCLARTAHAARGVRVLLTGPPGTGKSLAAEVLAAAAQTDLLRVDLSQVVSKWLGETEKNLGATFTAAERTHAVLLFDEADALFGSRTEISDAHDRYANLETAYLLQRLDAFQGLAVLTTNLRHNIDAAFLRRMDFVVELPTPDEAGRHDLWNLHLPTAHLAADVDVGTLARMYPVPGAWIRNAAVAAAFVAASSGEDIHQQHLTAAVRREYGKASLPYPGEPPRRTP